ncbi:hypothetical protein [Bradyrhizobium valentinum]|uniref:Uncharacterized protein n=1 Tax=Bradyrhizobium valentinum TaxID=1518501 RepID=A0A0R3LUC2_9BRAD|nr:hypothetical protein [Bradyrhizobium valentinum]KRR11586.1 hypothetical protein CP49_18330 [Bradyrhizobium valentinum]
MSTRARGSVDTQIPLREYFLWVGGALLVLLFAADSLLPAPSDLKGPEAVVIDTSQSDFLPVRPGKEFAVAPSPIGVSIHTNKATGLS